jgi:hypothetical protein
MKWSSGVAVKLLPWDHEVIVFFLKTTPSYRNAEKAYAHKT